MVGEIGLVYAATIEEAIAARDAGKEPVECAFGPVSVVGRRVLDHHGVYSNEEPVSIRAAGLVLEGDFENQWVVAGKPDCDQMYTIAALNHRIPIILEEARAIAELDTDWIRGRRDRTEKKYIRPLMVDQATEILIPGLESSWFALRKVIDVYNGQYGKKDVERAIEMERERKATIGQAIRAIDEGRIAFTVSDRKGYDVWFRHAPVVVNYEPGTGLVRFWLCTGKGEGFTERTGKEVLGESGLMPHYSGIDRALGMTNGAPGSGGRDVMGGSPINRRYSEEDGKRVFEYLRAQIIN
jgi:hypothetical protein